MRAATAGAFALGFASGVLALGVVVWRSGPGTPLVSARPVPVPVPYAVPSSPAPSAAPSPAAEVRPDRLTRMHLAMPIEGVKPESLTDSFHDQRDGRSHEAIDIPAPRGTKVRAVAEGNVVKLFTSKPGGLTVYQFDNSQTYCFYYAHLDRYEPGLKEGTLLRQGDVLGYVGTTGNAAGGAPHLHFAVFALGPEKKWWEGTPVNPLPLLK